MLEIYGVILDVVRELRPVIGILIERCDSDLGRQMRRAAASVALNVAEGMGSSGGNRTLRYRTALGSMQETIGLRPRRHGARLRRGRRCGARGSDASGRRHAGAIDETMMSQREAGDEPGLPRSASPRAAVRGSFDRRGLVASVHLGARHDVDWHRAARRPRRADGGRCVRRVGRDGRGRYAGRARQTADPDGRRRVGLLVERRRDGRRRRRGGRARRDARGEERRERHGGHGRHGSSDEREAHRRRREHRACLARQRRPRSLIRARRERRLEVRMGFEPTYDGFANRCLTTWLPHHPERAFAKEGLGALRPRNRVSSKESSRAGRGSCLAARTRPVNGSSRWPRARRRTSAPRPTCSSTSCHRLVTRMDMAREQIRT